MEGGEGGSGDGNRKCKLDIKHTHTHTLSFFCWLCRRQLLLCMRASMCFYDRCVPRALETVVKFIKFPNDNY